MNPENDHDITVTPFEHYMWVDDSALYPMVFFLKTSHDDPIDRERLQQALAAGIESYPLLRSSIQGRKTQSTPGLRWVPKTGSEAAADMVVAAESSWSRPDLKNDVGLRVFVDAAQNVLYWQFHHAVVDARGGLSLIRDVLGRYQSCPGTMTEAVDQNWIELRHHPFRLSRREKNARLSVDLQRITRFQTRPFFALRAGGTPRQSPPRRLPALNHRSRVLSRDEFEELRHRARVHGVSLNDLLLTAFFCGYFRWPKRQTRAGHLRIAMPIDMRAGSGAQGEVPANLVSMCFLDRQYQQSQDPVELLHDIHQETRQIKRDQMGIALCRVVGRLGRTPFGLGGFLRSKTPFSSLVVSNLGIVADLPKGLNKVELLPPVRFGNQLSVGIATVDGRLLLTGHFDPDALAAEDVDDLLDLTVGVWS